MTVLHRLIPGSERREFTTGTRRGSTNPAKHMEVIVVLTPGSHTRDFAAVVKAAERFGLSHLHNVGPHGIVLAGSVAQMQKAFQVSLNDYRTADGTFRCRSGLVSIPLSFGGNIVAVLGLDTRPAVRHCGRMQPRTFEGYTPPCVAKIYGFPVNSGGGHSVGIVEYGGAYQASAMNWYFSKLKINHAPHVFAYGRQHPEDLGGTDEVMLDSEIVATLVPSACTVLYFNPNTFAGFYTGIAQGVEAEHDAVSISWSGLESDEPLASMRAITNLAHEAGTRGVTITCSSGDNGSIGGVHFPTSSPFVLGCGGTTLEANCANYQAEEVWNANGGATGGGVSQIYALPNYQAGVAMGYTKRLVPDVASNADPGTGFLIRVHGESVLGGGTSAASPLWAALVCRLNRALGRKLGFINPALYALAGSLRQVTEGDNGTYPAGSPYNLCTGLGTPPENLLSLLS